jgi:hypothetical protein
MKNSMQITLKNEALINGKKTNDTFIKVYELQDVTLPLFLEI